MTQAVDIDGITLHYNKVGDGARSIILMHGWGCSSATLKSVENVAAEQCAVYNIDFPGFGDSPEPPAVWGVEEYTRLIEKMVKRLGIERPILLGHSFGGRVGILFASRNDVDRLILVDAAGVKPRRKLSYYYKVYKFKAFKFLANTFLPKEKAKDLIEAARNKRGSADYNSASPRMKQILSKVVNEDLRHVMPSISAPTLLIWGENDTATPIRDARIMERLIPDAGLVSWQGCGHYSFLDNPGGFAAVLRSFLSDK